MSRLDVGYFYNGEPSECFTRLVMMATRRHGIAMEAMTGSNGSFPKVIGAHLLFSRADTSADVPQMFFVAVATT